MTGDWDRYEKRFDWQLKNKDLCRMAEAQAINEDEEKLSGLTREAVPGHPELEREPDRDGSEQGPADGQKG